MPDLIEPLTDEQFDEIERNCRVCRDASLTAPIHRVEREAHAMHVELRRLRAAEQRVRALCEASRHPETSPIDCTHYGHSFVFTDHVLAALDGASDATN